MDKKKLELLIEIVKQSPDVNTDKLLQLMGMDDSQEQKNSVDDSHKQKSENIQSEYFERVIQPQQTITANTPHQQRTHYTKRDDEVIAAMLENGISHKEIAKRMNRSVSGIDTRISKLKKMGFIEVNKNNFNVDSSWTRFSTDDLKKVRSLLIEFDYVVKDIPKNRILGLAVLLGRTEKSIESQLYNLNAGRS